MIIIIIIINNNKITNFVMPPARFGLLSSRSQHNNIKRAIKDLSLFNSVNALIELS